ncbi:hypothetical protein AQF52_0154 [Streptomyces venezuelae]|nr:hypothetical protein AQF52_0154 [Streptomyces venezuelae]
MRAHQHTVAKGARRTWARTLPRRTDQQNPPRLRRTGQAVGLSRHHGQPQRLHSGRAVSAASA